MKLINNYRVFADIWPFSEDCREHGAPSRIYFNTPKKNVTVKTGLPYRGFELLYRGSYRNRVGGEVKMYEPLGRRWAWERPGVVVREHTWSSQG
jgi:hypothetical protein